VDKSRSNQSKGKQANYVARHRVGTKEKTEEQIKSAMPGFFTFHERGYKPDSVSAVA